MKQIPVGQGKFAIVDDEDYPVLSRFNWSWRHDPNKPSTRAWWMQYPVACFKAANGVTYNIPITRFLFHNLFSWAMFNPKDGDYLNCQKSNLVKVEISGKRQFAKKIRRKTSSIYKGVCLATWRKYGLKKPWMAYIHKKDGEKRKRYHLGYFYTQDEAALAYNKKAIELYGESAYQNIIK